VDALIFFGDFRTMTENAPFFFQQYGSPIISLKKCPFSTWILSRLSNGTDRGSDNGAVMIQICIFI
jgi:hypothetical protein